jgi:hypothetical protein
MELNQQYSYFNSNLWNVSAYIYTYVAKPQRMKSFARISNGKRTATKPQNIALLRVQRQSLHLLMRDWAQRMAILKYR